MWIFHAAWNRILKRAITDKVQNGVKNLYVLVNYTGLYTTHNILKRMEGKS